MKWLGKISACFIIIAMLISYSGVFFGFWISCIGLSMLLIGLIMVFYWSARSFEWKCSKCNNTFDITWQQNLFSLNMGVNDKMLYCPYCKEKNECKGKKKLHKRI